MTLDNDIITNPLEKEVLSACLRDRTALEKARDIVFEDCFLRPAHRALWTGLLSLPSGLVWDFKQIGLELKDRGVLQAIGGPAYLLEIHDSTFTTANIEFHCRQLKEVHLRRHRDVVIEKIKTTGTDSKTIARLQVDLAAIEKQIDGLRNAQQPSPAYAVADLIERTIAGQRRTVPLPWRVLDSLTQSLLPGTVSIHGGNVGACKSFAISQVHSDCSEQGIKSACLELEEDRPYHLLRALAQRTGLSGLTKTDWIEQNPDLAREAYTENADFLQAMGAVIDDCPERQMTLNEVAEWIEHKAREKCRVISVDPITAAAHTSKDTWNEDNQFIQRVKRAAVEYQCSIILISHPTKAVSCPDVSQLAGGAAYSRFAQTIIWWESHEPTTSAVKTDCGTCDIDHTRTVHILKARNGIGQGMRLAVELNKDSLTLRELGLICKKT